MTKTISFAPKPDRKEINNWVKERSLPVLRNDTKRVTVDIDAELHRRIKIACATEGLVLAEEMRKLIEQRFGGVGE